MDVWVQAGFIRNFSLHDVTGIISPDAVYDTFGDRVVGLMRFDGESLVTVGPTEKYKVVVPRPLNDGELVCLGVWSMQDGQLLAAVSALDNVCATDTITFTPDRGQSLTRNLLQERS